MSHGLTQRANGFVEMAWAGAKPWHTLGNELTHGAPIEQWIEQAGMDWKIQRSKIRYHTDASGENFKMIEDSHVLFRSDTKDALGIVSAKYQVVQPREVLEFFRDIVGESGFELETAGTMFGGKRFWALARVGESAMVLDQDYINGYLLLSTSADGTLATTAGFKTIRVVCNNTLSMALKAKDARDVTINHKVKFDHARVKDQLGLVHGEFSNFMLAARRLAANPIKLEEAEALTEKLLVESRTVTKDDVTRATGYKRVLELFKHGAGNHGETAWDWLNGVTEWVDHEQRAKSDSHRMANAWYGKGDALKTQALELALSI